MVLILRWGGSLNTYYPVGMVFISENSTSPGSFLGGSWERIQGVFPLFAGGNYSAGSSGGQENHSHGLSSGHAAILLTDRITLHMDSLPSSESWQATVTTTDGLIGSYNVTWAGQSLGAQLVGKSESSSNMPPYKTFYAWRRVA